MNEMIECTRIFVSNNHPTLKERLENLQFELNNINEIMARADLFEMSTTIRQLIFKESEKIQQREQWLNNLYEYANKNGNGNGNAKASSDGVFTYSD